MAMEDDRSTLHTPASAALHGRLGAGGPGRCINAAAAMLYLDHPKLQAVIHVSAANKQLHICRCVQYPRAHSSLPINTGSPLPSTC